MGNSRNMHQFDEETRTELTGENTFEGYIHPDWNIGDNPNGGYLVSLALNAISQLVPHPDPVSVTTHYLRPGTSGSVCHLTVDIIRIGTTLSTARATLIQADKERIVVIAAFSDLSQPAGIDSDITIAPVPIKPATACVTRQSDIQDGLPLPIMSRMEVLLDPDLTVPGKAGEARMSGWIGFRDGRDPTTNALPLFTDSFPPSPTGYLSTIGWVPTIELTVHCLAVPAPGLIQAEFVTDSLKDGRMIESGSLWDSNGHLIARSRQLGLVMSRD